MRHSAADNGSTRAPDDVLIVVPARNSSRRFPGKLLTPLHGEPLIRHTVKRALSLGRGTVVVGTADEDIASAVDDLCAVHISTAAHPTGTDRVYETWQALAPDTTRIINLQGDEPCLPVEALIGLLDLLNGTTEAASVCLPMSPRPERLNPDVVEVALDSNGMATGFSRSPIADHTDEWYRHIGVYGFSHTALAAHAGAERAESEIAEDLEQLRLMSLGYQFQMAVLEPWRDRPWPSVNRPDDVADALRFLETSSQDVSQTPGSSRSPDPERTPHPTSLQT